VALQPLFSGTVAYKGIVKKIIGLKNKKSSINAVTYET
jgi:hypothetical protein